MDLPSYEEAIKAPVEWAAAEHNNIINVEVFFFIFQSKACFHMRFNAEFLESFSIRNLIMHLRRKAAIMYIHTTATM